MKTCFVVLNYNDSERTTKFLNDVKTYNSIDEIVVVDNCSTDSSLDILKKQESKKIKIIKALENKGYGAGNNIGIKYIINKYKKANIFISNPDIVVKEETIINMCNVLNDNKTIGMCAPNILQDGKIFRGWKILSPIKSAFLYFPGVYRHAFNNNDPKYFYEKDKYDTKMTYVDVVTGCFFAIKSDVIKKINYFDENIFLYNEEEVIAKKLKDINLLTAILNSETVIHEHSVSINKSMSSLKKVKIANKSRIYYQKKYNNANLFELLICHITNFLILVKEFINIILRKFSR